MGRGDWPVLKKSSFAMDEKVVPGFYGINGCCYAGLEQREVTYLGRHHRH